MHIDRYPETFRNFQISRSLSEEASGYGVTIMCDQCCAVASFKVNIGSLAALPVFSLVTSAVGVLTLIVLLIKMTWDVRKQLDYGEKLQHDPVLGVRQRNQSPRALHPWYHGYLVMLIVVLVLEAVAQVLSSNDALSMRGATFWLATVIGPIMLLLDQILLGFIALPTITRKGLWIVYGVAAIVFVSFMLFIIFRNDMRPW
jgi:hypothetical protein